MQWGTSTSRLGLVALFALLAGCTSLEGPRFRYATQTAEALMAIEQQEVVWLEFQEGDVIPLAVRVGGMIEGQTDQPMRLVARRTFYLVHRRGQAMRFSVDGETLIEAYPGRGILAFGVENGSPQLGLLMLLEESRTAGGEE
jgi:hypothetical protein